MSASPWVLAAAGVLLAASFLTFARNLFGGDAARRELLLLGAPRTVDGPLQRVAPALKLLGVIALAVAAAVTPLERLGLPALLLLALGAASRVPPAELLTRLGELAPFVVLASLGAALAGDPQRLALVLARALLTVLALNLLLATTSLPDLVAGARRLGLPPVLAGTLALALRYLSLLLEEASRMALGYRARAVGPRDLRQARSLGRLMGSLGLRSLERGERVHRAMLARGYDGALPSLHAAAPVRGVHVAGLLVFVALLAGGAAWPT